MKILSLGLDSSVLNKNSVLAGRVIEYGGLVDEYAIVVPSVNEEIIQLSEKAIAYGSGGETKLSQFFKIYQLAKKLLAEENFNVLTVQDQYYLALIGSFLAKKYKFGLEIQVHGFEKYYGLRKIIFNYVLPRADAVRCVSQRLKKQLMDKFKISESKITVVPIFTEIKVAAKKDEVTKNKFIFLTVGRLVPVKNIAMQIEAMKEVIKKYPNLELWIIGDGSEKKNYELDKNIKLLGWKDDLKEFYNMADAFVLSSNYEGWGMVVIEAASYGLPIIMTDVGCAGEVIKNNESGLIIPVGDKEKLVAAMIKIVEDKELRKKIGENAKLAISQLPTKEKILDLYKKSWKKTILWTVKK
jgi:glycosyltransferase involved in cell wall biosynthesis